MATATQERFSIEAHLGEGGTGRVYRAIDSHLKRRVALKFLQEELLQEPEQLEKLQQEALHLAALNHPNVVNVYDLGISEHGPFLVMEYLEGQTLQAHLQEHGPLPAEDVMLLARQALAGLVAAHRLDLLHRDLKPGNIMLSWLESGDLQVKLLDFGLAKHSPTPTTQTMDHGAGIYGSIHNMAPEQFDRRPLDARTDLYSLGSVLYEAAVGHSAFEGDTISELIVSHMHPSYPPLQQLRPDLPGRFSFWVSRLMAVRPEDRPATAHQALVDLKNIDQTVPSLALAPEPNGASGNAKKHWLALLAGCTILAVTGWFAWSLIFPEPESQPGISTMEETTPEGVERVEPVEESIEATVAQEEASVEAIASSAVDWPLFQPTQLDEIRSYLGQNIRIQGRVLRVSENTTRTIDYLNFTDDYRLSVSGVLFKVDTAFTKEELLEMVGKTIEVSGPASEHRGSLQLIIRSRDQIKTL
ncbi:MAG: protein kinase [Verrucomicrobiales bacterium]